jgi:hypothetical protein
MPACRGHVPPPTCSGERSGICRCHARAPVIAVDSATMGRLSVLGVSPQKATASSIQPSADVPDTQAEAVADVGIEVELRVDTSG